MHRLVCLLMLLGIATALQAQPYPNKPIRIIIPFPPGDSLDTMSRLISPTLTARLGQNIIVDNRSGAAGQLGLELGARAVPDGYTIVGGQGGNLVVQPHTYKKLPYDPLKDFVPIANSTSNFLVLVTAPTAPFKTVKELIAYGRANPGKLSFASNGEGGFPHMAIEMLRTGAGFTYLHVPFKGGVQIMTELMAGRMDATILGVASAVPYVKGGRVRLIAVTSPARQDAFPDVPTIAESGVPGYAAEAWSGMLAPAQTPREIIVKLNTAVARIVQSAEMTAFLLSRQTVPKGSSIEEFTTRLRQDVEKKTQLIRQAKIRVE